MTNPENIFLIGYRGTGKSTVARLLAGQLGWAWVDADALLEARLGRTIRDLFEKEGEASFREKEAALLEELCRGRRQVIATGGGIILRPGNRARLKESGRVVWLTADVETIWQRLREDVNTPNRRPTLTVGGRAEIEELLQGRAAWYQVCADLTVDTVGRAPNEIVAAIRQEWKLG